jgi:hypothetical protein
MPADVKFKPPSGILPGVVIGLLIALAILLGRELHRAREQAVEARRQAVIHRTRIVQLKAENADLRDRMKRAAGVSAGGAGVCGDLEAPGSGPSVLRRFSIPAAVLGAGGSIVLFWWLSGRPSRSQGKPSPSSRPAPGDVSFRGPVSGRPG